MKTCPEVPTDGPVSEVYLLEDGDDTVVMAREQFMRLLSMGEQLLSMPMVPATEVRLYGTR